MRRRPVTPPACRGLPLLGNLLDYRRDHLEIFWRSYEALGDIFAIRLGPQRAVVLIGPDNHRFFFTQADRALTLPEVYRFVVPMFGPVLNAADDERVRKAQLALLHSAFQGDKMNAYVAVMAEEISAWLDELGDAGSFEMNESFARLGIKIAASAFMGHSIRRRMAEFIPLYDDLARGMEFVLPPYLPLPRFRRRDRARVLLHQLIGPLIQERRQQPDRYDDFLQTIVQGGDTDPARDVDEVVVGLALMTLFTAYITTAAQASWSLLQLLQHRDYVSTVYEEVGTVLDGGGSVPTVRDLHRLERLGWALKETQRLHPVMTHYARHTARDYQLGGYHVPRGWITMVCPAISHRLPEVFSDPGRYDPERFSPGREEDRRRPYSLIGFGAGLYRCPGAGFGMNEMACLIALLLQRFDLELLTSDPARDFEMGVIRPSTPCLVRYRRRVPGRAAKARRAVMADGPGSRGLDATACQGLKCQKQAEA